jgi:hypothetical protein
MKLKIVLLSSILLFNFIDAQKKKSAVSTQLAKNDTKKTSVSNSTPSSSFSVEDNPVRTTVNFSSVTSASPEVKEIFTQHSKLKAQTLKALMTDAVCSEVIDYINKIQESNEAINNYVGFTNAPKPTENTPKVGNVTKMGDVTSIPQMVEILPSHVDNLVQISKSNSYARITILMKDFVENSKANARSYKLVHAITSYLNLNPKSNLLIQLPAFSSSTKKEKNKQLEYLMTLMSQLIKPTKVTSLQNRIQIKQQLKSYIEIPSEEILLMNEEIFSSQDEKINFYLYY